MARRSTGCTSPSVLSCYQNSAWIRSKSGSLSTALTNDSMRDPTLELQGEEMPRIIS
ncbi:hypothetical protein AG1IA_00457 [Rhizoctonia solani AG-1 IA]|uniref:Uncharacterized protein n=1 Tax=Thanatephorus cucumeris (strain AG1-IA) TaxID=983506 RepID=L8X8V7_THACA|nr:hypothetical protein AG1IA_00457 [Rhizoctonia solani AG-1 IA]